MPDDTCPNAHCGDGFVWVGHEPCDDGNSSNTDGCTNACQLPRCGDGFQQRGEECDDGNTDDTDFCDNTCKVAGGRGDGKRAPGSEECDQGPLNGDRPSLLITQPSGTSVATDAIVHAARRGELLRLLLAVEPHGLEQVGESRIYLYMDSNTGRQSLILTHGIDQGTSGQNQPASAVNMDIAGLPSGVRLDLSDDPGEATMSGSTARGRWTFNANSDGMVLGGFRARQPGR